MMFVDVGNWAITDWQTKYCPLELCLVDLPLTCAIRTTPIMLPLLPQRRKKNRHLPRDRAQAGPVHLNLMPRGGDQDPGNRCQYH